MRRSNDIAWAQVRGGILLLLALICLAGAIMLLGEKTKLFVPKGQLTVIMGDVAGLKIGAPVWLAGVDVGIVEAIRFEAPERSNDVEILLQVERGALKKIGKDSVITVKTRGLLGEKYVDITPSMTLHEVPETRLTGTPVPRLDEVLQKAGKAFDRVNAMVGEGGSNQGTLSRLAKDPKLYDNLARLTGELDTLVRSVNRGEGTVGKLVRNDEPYNRLVAVLNRADGVFQKLQSDQGTMGKLLNDPRLYDRVLSVAEKSERVTDDLRELNRRLLSQEGTMGKLINDRQAYDKGMALLTRLDASTGSLEQLLAELQRGEGSAGKLLKDRELYDRLDRLVQDMDLLVKDVKENPRRYIRFSVF